MEWRNWERPNFRLPGHVTRGGGGGAENAPASYRRRCLGVVVARNTPASHRWRYLQANFVDFWKGSSKEILAKGEKVVGFFLFDEEG